MPTLGEALNAATETLSAAGCASPANDAQILAAHLLGCGTMELALRRSDEAPAGFEEYVRRRAQREPLQHILGVAWFGPLELSVGPGVFIPRPETEVLADWAAQHALAMVRAGKTPTVVDLCTGSGAIAAYVANACPHARVWAVELSPAALPWAEKNLPDGVTLVQADVTDSTVLAELNGQVDIVVSNPPYVPETPDLEPEVYCDPHMAVFSGADGMELINTMIPTVARLLTSGGVAGIEHDDTTSRAVMDALQAHGCFSDVKAMKDLTGTDRFVTARLQKGVNY